MLSVKSEASVVLLVMVEELFAGFRSPPPDTVAVFTTDAGAFEATWQPRLMAG
jgi:hypothetical protein